MSARRYLAFLSLSGAALLLIAGCVSDKTVQHQIPAEELNVQLGRQIELVKVKTSREKVKIVADRSGGAHVIVASPELKQVLEVVVRPEGIAQRRVIRSGISPDQIDGALDAHEKLHVLIDAEHWVFEHDRWRRSDTTPWQSAGIRASDIRFVAGAPGLIWSFDVSGTQVGAPNRVDIWGFGGYGAALVWPWLTHGSRAVIVAELPSGYGRWLVLGAHGVEDTAVQAAAADRAGNIYVVYSSSRGGILSGDPQFRYTRIGADLLTQSANAVPSSQDTWFESGQLLDIEGRPLSPLERQCMNYLGRCDSLAVTPNGDIAVVGLDWIVRNDRWSPGEKSPPSLYYVFLTASKTGLFYALTVGEPEDSWWGKHFPVHYRQFIDGRWSAPILIGTADVESFWGVIWHAFDLASVNGNGVFAAWPTDDGIVGRWITPIDSAPH